MNVVSRAMTSSADCSPSARKNTETLSIDETLNRLGKADNVIGAHGDRRYCLMIYDAQRNPSGLLPRANQFASRRSAFNWTAFAHGAQGAGELQWSRPDSRLSIRQRLPGKAVFPRP